ncbi:amidohydrolase family protein [Synoicihabitans lomoniglobus]|uniref:Amidohydrolase family protein n=1 Tax=Synoicihabitans lomoniglobus TaxID=2909285 RepID=A0AAF0I2M9_9BACT|nr:amidohydrolase family protein [Opitutaceae bacterium LMO-M01]WED66627.1 amidohydrolase family protein [Opitutaceae bacterium LMO-M01]
MLFNRSRALLVSLLGLVLVASWASADSAKLIVTNAKLFTMAEGQPDPFDGHLVIGHDGRILAVGPGGAAGWESENIVDLAGAWVLPGFVPAHSHLWQSAWRGLAADQTLMGWVDALYLQHARYAQPEDFYWFTLQGALDHVRHGITSTYNFNYGGWAEREMAQAQLRGEMESGVRFVHGQNFGGWGEVPQPAEAIAEVQSFLDWMDSQPTGDQLLRVMVNGTAAFRDTANAAETEAAIARTFALGNHLHFLESAPDQYEERSRFRWMIDEGLITDKILFGHFIHVDPWILEQAVAAGASMSWNPLSNGRLASGTPDIPLYLKTGLRIGMGVDGQASADRADPWENVRTGLYAVRAKYGDASVLSPYQVLRMHTWGSADAMGVADKVGSLEVGKFGDFVVIDPTDFGVVFDAYATLAFMAGQEHMTGVYIGGERVVAAGETLKHDFAGIRIEVNQRVRQAGAPGPTESQ